MRTDRYHSLIRTVHVNSSSADMATNTVNLVLLLLIVAGLALAAVGLIWPVAEDGRLVLGGLTLVMSGIAGMGAFGQLVSGETVVRVSRWRSRTRFVGKKDRPVRFWISTILFAGCSTCLLVFSILILVYGDQFLTQSI